MTYLGGSSRASRRRRPGRARGPRGASRRDRRSARGSGSSRPRASSSLRRSSSAGSTSCSAPTAGTSRRRRKYPMSAASPVMQKQPPEHAPMLQCPAELLATPCADPPGTGAEGQGRLRPREGETGALNDYEILLMLDPELPEDRRRRDRHAHARARREGRRHLGGPPAVGPPAARVRDRPQAGGRLPPADVHVRADRARRDLARPEDHGRRHAAPGDPPPAAAPARGGCRRSVRARGRRVR